MVSIMEGVVQRGTAQKLKVLNRPIAGKTGTTNDEKDAWFIGYTPDLVVGVYIGFDNPSPLGHGETGGNVSAPVVRDFFKIALADQPPIPFRAPPGIHLVRVNKKTGLPASPGDPRRHHGGLQADSGSDRRRGRCRRGRRSGRRRRRLWPARTGGSARPDAGSDGAGRAPTWPRTRRRAMTGL